MLRDKLVAEWASPYRPLAPLAFPAGGGEKRAQEMHLPTGPRTGSFAVPYKSTRLFYWQVEQFSLIVRKISTRALPLHITQLET